MLLEDETTVQKVVKDKKLDHDFLFILDLNEDKHLFSKDCLKINDLKGILN